MRRTLELVEAEVSARSRWHFLVLRHGDRVAVGECSDAGHPARLLEQVAAVRRRLAGRDLVADRQEVLADLADQVSQSDPDDRLVVATLMGGLEQMMVDHAAQAAGEPVWKWLGGSAPDSIPVYANINRMPGGRSPEDVAAMARRAVAAGFTSVKCAPFDVSVPGEPLAATGMARLRAIRAAIGDEAELKVDCHERLPAEEVHRLLPGLEDLGIAWLEDAVSIGSVAELRALRAATTLPLAGGELMFEPEEARAAVTGRLIDVLMPDVKHAGGVERVLRIARTAPDLAISPHNPSGPVATAASAHAFAACSNATVLEYQFGETSWRSELVSGLERVVNGRLYLNDRPGLGVTLQPNHPSCRVLWSANI
ncbi:enolase C-terminal domain-like protein [Nonomuraea guangzhouensis]|uniref:Enolase C-terminal domain-like protein n=1 Tax=Nonomuraea guangzhouensis TaxID=1291555 RepID=A0ABW4GAG1_9ACTN|nr:enolase C-terminal domain-like protein [Nonomuraea guangzhouensis]